MKVREKVLEDLRALPPAPDVAWRVMRIVRDPDYDADDLLRAVELDPSVTSLLLKTVNSSLVGLRQPAGSLQQAIVLLGGKKIVDLVLTISAADSFTGLSGGYVLEQRGLWRHSITVAAASELLATKLHARHDGLAFTAGLLHDLGKIVLNAHVDAAGEEIQKLLAGEDASFLETERQLLGTDHCEMGATVAEKWKLPEDLALSIRYHHAPSEAPEGTARTLARLVHVADVSCMTMGIGIGLDGLGYEVEPETLAALDLSPEDLELLSLDILDRLEQVEEFLKL